MAAQSRRILQIQDINHHLASNGIIQAADGAGEDAYQRLDHVEFADKLSKQEQFQSTVIGKFIEEDENKAYEEEAVMQRERILEDCRGVTISMSVMVGKSSDIDESSNAANGDTNVDVPKEDIKEFSIIENVSLSDLASHCDTIFTLVSSPHWSSDVKARGKDYIFPMDQFDGEAVKCFLSILKEKCPTESESDAIEAAVAIAVQSIPVQYIIECCYIADYLQSKEILNDIAEVIGGSITAENCTSICILADELQIPSLLQLSMKYVMTSLEDIQNDAELWDDIPKSLKNHILTLKNAARSSIIGHSSKKTLFSSSDEFLAIFHDILTLNKERLIEAKQRLSEVIDERKQEEDQRGRFSSRSVRNANADDKTYCDIVQYTALKIEKQEMRVKTLQAFYDQQKAIFAQDVESGYGQYRVPFEL